MKRFIVALGLCLNWAIGPTATLLACEKSLTRPTPEEYLQKMKVFVDNLSWQITDLRFDFNHSARFNLFLRADQGPRSNDAPPEFQAQRLLISQIIEEFFKLHQWSKRQASEPHQVTVQALPRNAQAMVNIGTGVFVDSLLHDAGANIWHKMAASPLTANDLKNPLQAYQNFLNANGGIQEEGIQVEYHLPWPRSIVYLDGPIWGVINKEPRLLPYLNQVMAQKAIPGSCAKLPSQGAYDNILKTIFKEQPGKIKTYLHLVRERYQQSVSLLALLQVINRPDASKLSPRDIKNNYSAVRKQLMQKDKIYFYFVAPTWNGDTRGPLELFALEITAGHKLFMTPPTNLAKLDLTNLPPKYNWPIRRLTANRPMDSIFLARNGQYDTVGKNFGQIRITTNRKTAFPISWKRFRKNIHHAYQTAWNGRKDGQGESSPDTIMQAKEDMQEIYQLLSYIHPITKGLPSPKKTLQLLQNNEWQIFFFDLRDKVKNTSTEKIGYVGLLDIGAYPFRYRTATISPITKSKKQ